MESEEDGGRGEVKTALKIFIDDALEDVGEVALMAMAAIVEALEVQRKYDL